MSKEGMNAEEKKIIRLTAGSHALVHLFEGVLPPLIPLLLLEFGTDYFHLGLVVTAFSYAFGLGSVPAGLLADMMAPRKLISVYLFGSGLLAVAIWPVGTLAFYGLCMAGVGLFCSTYHPASNTLISLEIRAKGSAFGIHGIAGSLGVAIAPVLSAAAASLLGWQAPHVLFGLLAVLMGVYSLSLPDSGPRKPPPAGASGNGPQPAAVPYLKLVVFFLSVTALGFTYKGIMTFLPAYLGENVHLAFLNLDTLALGGTVATLALLSGAAGQYMAGRLADRYSLEHLYLLTTLVGTVFVFGMAVSQNLLLVAAAVVYAFFYFATQPIQNYLIAVYMPEHRRGLGYGIQFGLNFGVGSTAAAIAGYLADHFGLKSVFLFAGACFVLASLLTGLLAFRARKP